MVSYEEMSWNTFGWVIDSRSLPVSFFLSFSFLLILLMTVLMCILLFFIEIVYCFMASFSQ